jgi:tetratricopeptide (TPR) repeat protein
MDDLEGLAEVSYQLAIGHHIASNLSYAGIYYRDAQRLFQQINDIRKVAFCHHGLGKLLLQMGKTDLAIIEFDRALSIYNTIPDQPQVSSRIGDIHYYKRIITKMQDPTLTHQTL